MIGSELNMCEQTHWFVFEQAGESKIYCYETTLTATQWKCKHIKHRGNLFCVPLLTRKIKWQTQTHSHLYPQPHPHTDHIAATITITNMINIDNSSPSIHTHVHASIQATQEDMQVLSMA